MEKYFSLAKPGDNGFFSEDKELTEEQKKQKHEEWAAKDKPNQPDERDKRAAAARQAWGLTKRYINPTLNQSSTSTGGIMMKICTGCCCWTCIIQVRFVRTHLSRFHVVSCFCSRSRQRNARPIEESIPYPSRPFCSSQLHFRIATS